MTESKAYELVLRSIYIHKSGIGLRDISRLTNLQIQSVQRQIKILKKQELVSILKRKNKFSISYNYKTARAKAYAAFFDEFEKQKLILNADNLSPAAQNLLSSITSMLNFAGKLSSYTSTTNNPSPTPQDN